MRYVSLVVLFLLCMCISFAQKTLKEESSYKSISVEFINDAVYAGRKDSVATPYITPSFSYFDHSGFYASLSASILSKGKNMRMDLINLSAGYQFTTGKLNGNIFAEKYFYNGNSTNVKSEVQGALSFSGNYEFHDFELFFEPGVNLSAKPDVYFDAGLMHHVQVSEALELSPCFQLNATTRNFYSSYFGKRKNKHNANLSGYNVTAEVEDASKMKVMSYELSLPVQYTNGNFSLEINPVYSMAVNPAIVTKTIHSLTIPAPIKSYETEPLSNLFYWSVSLSLQF